MNDRAAHLIRLGYERDPVRQGYQKLWKIGDVEHGSFISDQFIAERTETEFQNAIEQQRAFETRDRSNA